jgi:hypothetical protein
MSTTKRTSTPNNDIDENLTKKSKAANQVRVVVSNEEKDEIIEQAWYHYRTFLESENEMNENEASNVDELHEVIALLGTCGDDGGDGGGSAGVDVQRQIREDHISIESLSQQIQKGNGFDASNFDSVQALLPALLSMVYLHIGNDLISQGFTATTGSNIENNNEMNDPLIHLEKSLMYFPCNASTLSILANYKRMNKSDSVKNICTLYEYASDCAHQIRDMAISILDEDDDDDNNADEDESSSQKEDVYNEWVELLLLDGMSGVEFIGDDDDDNADAADEEKDNNANQQESEYSSSDVESISSFMAAMLHSSLGNHDEALNRLKKFHISHRIHPKVWEFAKRTLTNETTKLVAINTSVTESRLDFEPKAFRGNVLPQHLYDRLCTIFNPKGTYWKESDYQNRGYYSFFNDINDKVKSNPSNIVEDLVVNHLLPLVEKEQPSVANKIVGFEWWTHTRPLSANLGHQMHFDTDELFLEKEKKLTHPVVSSVLYLTGNKTNTCQSAGSTIVFNQTPDSKEVASKAYVSHALDNSYMIFPGNCLHGVLPCPGTGTNDIESDDTVERLTLMIGFWTRRVPDNFEEVSLYSPCSPLPPDNDEHSWIKDIKCNYPQTELEDEAEEVVKYDHSSGTTLPSISPAWESTNHIEDDVSSLAIPCSLDHRFFVYGAPECFRDSLFKNESLF